MPTQDGTCNDGDQFVATADRLPLPGPLPSIHEAARRTVSWVAWLPGLWATLALLLYLTLVAHRPVIFMPGSDEDDGLFIRLALNLVSGHWLGHYDGLTLAKGSGFPIFLALNYMIGLPINLGLCLFYAAACLYLSLVVAAVLQSRLCVPALLTALLFIPPLSSWVTARIDRDFFYTALTVYTMASVINLFLACERPRSPYCAALLAGGLTAWFWITREEGFWLLPALAFLPLRYLFLPRWKSAVRRCVIAGSAAAAVVGSIGLVNLAAYGRFTLTEMNSGPFEAALVALEKASYPDWAPYLPVSAAARARIYPQSPTFARLKPLLDPADGRSTWAGECDQVPVDCNEIAGGWFAWALKKSAAQAGFSANAAATAAFFRSVDDEVSQACAAGQLACARWVPPLVPPVTRKQIREFPGNLWNSALMAGMVQGAPTEWPPIAALSGLEHQWPELLSVGEHQPGRILAVSGLASTKDGMLDFAGSGSTEIIKVTQQPGPGDAADPGAKTTDVELTLACLFDPCAFKLIQSSGAETTVPIPLLLKEPESPLALSGGGTLELKAVDSSGLTLRTRLNAALNRNLPVLQTFYQALLALGTFCALLIGIHAIWTRTLSPVATVLVALELAVSARICLVAIVDATAFPAADYNYLAPSFPLSVSIAVIAIFWFATRMAALFRAPIGPRPHGQARSFSRVILKAEL